MTEYILDYCIECYQMTNHLNGICQKCKSTTPTEPKDEGKEAVDGWIRVEDRLPDDRQLVYFHSNILNEVISGKFYKEDVFKRKNVFISNEGGPFVLKYVEHWYPIIIPQPPIK